jgi:hypothetical protein
MSPHTERSGRLEAEAGCFVLLTTVPTAGTLAQRARELLTVYHEHPGTEQNYGFRKAPVMVNSLGRKKPARIEALGLILVLALRLWRLRERTMRRHVDPTRTPWPGWDKKVTERPTSVMMGTKCAGVIVVQLGSHRHLARPLSGVHHQYRTALDVPATCCTLPTGSQKIAMAAQRLSRRQQHILPWWAADHQRTRGIITRSHQDWGRAWPGDKGNSSQSLRTREARGLLVVGRSPGGKAASVWLTSEGQKWASQLAGSCDEGESSVAATGYRQERVCRELPILPLPGALLK